MDSRGLEPRSFATSGPVFATVRRNVQENLHLPGRRCENVPCMAHLASLLAKLDNFCESLVGKFIMKYQKEKNCNNKLFFVSF